MVHKTSHLKHVTPVINQHKRIEQKKKIVQMISEILKMYIHMFSLQLQTLLILLEVVQVIVIKNFYLFLELKLEKGRIRETGEIIRLDMALSISVG